MDGLHKRNNQIIAEVITGYWAVITPAGLCSCPAKSEKITEDITETRKYIIKIPRPAVTAVFQAIMPVGIIYLSLLIITEHFVRLSAFLEFGLGFFIIGITVRMIFHRKLSVGFFYLAAAGTPAH
jgi:hypothetical protein